MKLIPPSVSGSQPGPSKAGTRKASLRKAIIAKASTRKAGTSNAGISGAQFPPQEILEPSSGSSATGPLACLEQRLERVCDELAMLVASLQESSLTRSFPDSYPPSESGSIITLPDLSPAEATEHYDFPAESAAAAVIRTLNLVDRLRQGQSAIETVAYLRSEAEARARHRGQAAADWSDSDRDGSGLRASGERNSAGRQPPRGNQKRTGRAQSKQETGILSRGVVPGDADPERSLLDRQPGRR
jgi:hypothetical protein